jgi:DNA polymerase V
MSRRLTQVLAIFAPSLAVYSIDEAFLGLTGVCHQDPIAYDQRIKKSPLKNL